MHMPVLANDLSTEEAYKQILRRVSGVQENAGAILANVAGTSRDYCVRVGHLSHYQWSGIA